MIYSFAKVFFAKHLKRVHKFAKHSSHQTFLLYGTYVTSQPNILVLTVGLKFYAFTRL